jgi:hypothetical protein
MTKVRRYENRPGREVTDSAIDTAISLCWDAYHQVLRAHEVGSESAALRAEASQLRRQVVAGPEEPATVAAAARAVVVTLTVD